MTANKPPFEGCSQSLGALLRRWGGHPLMSIMEVIGNTESQLLCQRKSKKEGIYVWVRAQLLQSYLTLCNPMDCIAHQAPQTMEFSRKEYWSGLPCSPPRDLPDSGIKPASPALQADSLLLSRQRSRDMCICIPCSLCCTVDSNTTV